MSREPYCPGCGRASSRCTGCQAPLDPPRFCTTCGSRLRVQLTPRRVLASCAEHGPQRSGIERVE